jgi:prepilin-type N-terminal cleavage/methylation domain-containing protein
MHRLRKMQLAVQRRTGRPAMTLVEVMVAVAITSIFAGVAVSLLVELREWDRDMRRRSVQSEQLIRLGEAMRADIRQAANVSQPDTAIIEILAANETLTRYELSPEGCRRVVTTPGDPMPRSDAFTVGPATSWTLAPAAAGRRTMFAVTLHRGANEERVTPLVVYAAAGADAPRANE